MNVFLRAKNILLQPSQEWPAIAAEPADSNALFRQYAAVLAAVGPIAAWLGNSLIGTSVPLFGTIRTPLLAGLVFAVGSYVLALVGVFVAGLIVNALAPTFNGEKNAAQAMKCVVYAYTPAWLAGILHLIPGLWILVLLASLYSLYLLYLGLPVLMKSPKDKAAGYTVVVVLCAIVLNVVLRAVGGLMALTTPGLHGPGMFGGSTNALPGMRPEAKPTPDSVLGKLDTLGTKLEESNRKMKEATKKGDSAAAMGAAMEGLATMAGGGRKVDPISVDTLKAFLPATLDGMQRSDVTTEQSSFGPISVAMANAVYQDGSGRRVRVGVGDMAAAGGLLALAAMLGAGQSKESDAGYEKIHKVDGRLVIEKKDKRSGAAEYGVVLAERFVVNTSSPNGDPEALKALVGRLDLPKLEAMKDAGVQK
jgi:hypothetical protein